MPFRVSRTRPWALCALLLVPLAGSTFAAAPNPAPAIASTKAQTLSTLGGKFSFSLPAGYAQTALPPGEAGDGTAGAKGTMYMNPQQRRVVMVTEVPIPNGVKTGDNDDEFLSGASQGFIRQQSQALPDFKKTGEKRFTLGKLGVEQVDSTASMGGGPTLSSTFLAGSGSTMSLVQVISRATDKAGHEALVKTINKGQ